MKKQNGITLIALIITIIVILILVGVTVATISDGGLFQKAKTAAEKTEEKAIYEQLVGAMKFGADGKIDVKETFDGVKTVLGEKVELKSPSTVDEITGNATIEVTGKNGKTYTYKITENEIDIYLPEEINEYGFYYNTEYVTRGFRITNDIVKVKISKDGKVYIYSWQDSGIREGKNHTFVDYMGQPLLTINPVEHNKKYTYIDDDQSQYTMIVNDKGETITNIIIDKKNVEIENKKVSIGQYMILVFSEDGKSYTLGDKTFKIE